MTKSSLAAAAVLFATTGAAAPQQDLGIALGATAPPAVVQTLDGKDVNLAAYLGKSPVVIEFWATWCENCQALEPQVIKLAKQYAGKVTFIGVAVSVNQSPARVKSYATQHGLQHVILYDTHGAATGAYDVPATSYVVVVGKNGKVVYTGVGGGQVLGEAVRKGVGGA